MKQNLTRIVGVLLALMMILSAVSCGNPTANEPDESTAPPPQESEHQTTDSVSEAETENPYQLHIPDGINYNNYEFNIGSTANGNAKYTFSYMTAVTETAEPLNDATYLRNILVQNLLGIQITETKLSVADANTHLSSQDDAYGIMNFDLSHVMDFVCKGYTIDFNTVDTIDLTMPWWDQNAQEKLSFSDKYYYAFSDMTIFALDNSRATYFNKELASKLNLPNLYDLSRSGKWTVEQMSIMCKQAVNDVNGDGHMEIGVDCFGIVDSATTMYEAFLTSCDAEIIKQGKDGIPYFYCLDQQEAFINIYTKLLDLFSKDNIFIHASTANSTSSFSNGLSLFYVATLSIAASLRNVELDFGILPVAKLTAEQENYYSVTPNPHATVIPYTTRDLDRTGVILETLSFYSSSYYSDSALIPQYFELALKSKSARDEESVESLQIIHDNISYIIKIAGSELASSIYASFQTADYQIASTMKQFKKAAERELEDVLNKLG